MKKYSFIIFIFILSGCSLKYTDNLVDKGSRIQFGNRYKKAMRIYNRAIFFNKKSARAYWRRGILYTYDIYNNNCEKAIADFSKSIKIDTLFNEGDAFVQRADCKSQLNDTAGALLDYNRAIAINPLKESYYCSRGEFKFYKLRDIDGALIDLDKAINLWKNYIQARVVKAELEIERKNYKRALEEYDTLSNIFPIDEGNSHYKEIFYYRGIARYEVGDKNGACKDWIISSKLGYSQAKDKLKVLCN